MLERAVNECMEVYNSNERFEVYKREHMQDLENKVPGQIKRWNADTSLVVWWYYPDCKFLETDNDVLTYKDIH